MHKKLITLLTSCIYIIFTQQASALNELNNQEVERFVYNYLIEHPFMLPAIQENLKKQEQAAILEKRNQILRNYNNRIYNFSEDLILGDPHARHTIIAFLGYDCFYCKQSAEDIESVVAKHKDLRVIIKELPLFGGESPHLVSRAFHSLYPNKQQEFWHQMMILPEDATAENAVTIAVRLGADINLLTKKLNADIADLKKDKNLHGYLLENRNFARNLEISPPVPFYIVNGKIYDGIWNLEKLTAEANKN